MRQQRAFLHVQKVTGRIPRVEVLVQDSRNGVHSQRADEHPGRRPHHSVQHVPAVGQERWIPERVALGWSLDRDRRLAAARGYLEQRPADLTKHDDAVLIPRAATA